jgi:hypothetical protein
MRRAAVITLSVCGLGLVAPGIGRAAGGPVLPVVGSEGITVPGSPFRFAALPAGKDTRIERLRRDDGTVTGRALLHGHFGVPGATIEGAETGLSADARTLVLGGVAFNTRRTQLVVMDTVPLRVRARIALRGFFTVDAISPTGRWLYLIHYRSPARDITNYEVRAYDLPRRQLLSAPVVDPREPSEKMVGIAMTRALSADGRWAYTLYGGNATPFIHALDTETRRAFCIDVPMLSGDDASNATLALGPGPVLKIERDGLPLALISTRTFTARRAAPPAPPASPARPSQRRSAPASRAGSGRDGVAVQLAIAVFVALAAIALLVFGRRARRAGVREDVAGELSGTDGVGPRHRAPRLGPTGGARAREHRRRPTDVAPPARAGERLDAVPPEPAGVRGEPSAGAR